MMATALCYRTREKITASISALMRADDRTRADIYLYILRIYRKTAQLHTLLQRPYIFGGCLLPTGGV